MNAISRTPFALLLKSKCRISFTFLELTPLLIDINSKTYRFFIGISSSLIINFAVSNTIPSESTQFPRIPAWKKYAVPIKTNGKNQIVVVVDDMGLDQSRSRIIENLQSESVIAFRMLKKKIPNDENTDNWEKIRYNDQEYFLKIPEGQNKDNYMKILFDRLENKNRPHATTKVKIVRVVKPNEN